jgi:type II secretory pathway component HofQ
LLRIRASIAALVVTACLGPLGQAAAQAPMGQAGLIPALGFEEADVRSVLTLIADFGAVNIVPDGQVVGRVTLQLRNVSWLDALDAVMVQLDLVSISTR